MLFDIPEKGYVKKKSYSSFNPTVNESAGHKRNFLFFFHNKTRR